MIRKFTTVVILAFFSILSPQLRAQTIVFSEAFPAGTPAASVCTNWSAFRAALVPLPYNRLRFTGSLSSTVFECTNPTIIADIALKLRTLPTPATANAFSWVDGPITWQLGTDISGRFGVNTSSLSSCDNPGHMVKPCIGSANWGGFGTATCGGPAQTITIEFFYGYPMDNASASAITSPSAFCPGTHNIELKVKNTGHNIINSVQIDWMLDGVAQMPIFWNTPIDTAGSVAGNEALVLLGTEVFGSTPRTIKAWTTMPNNVADTSNYDDTVSTTLRASMSGLYTIGGSGANYPTFAAAVADLNLLGVCGPVTFMVNPGTYTEQVILTPVFGASAVNTITFDGGTSTLAFGSATSAERAVVKLNGADYITFTNFTINASGNTYGHGVQMLNDANNNTISNCNIITNAVSTSTTNYAGILINSSATSITAAGASLCDSNRIIGNTITGGYAGIAIVANGSTSQVADNVISNNEIKDFYLYGVYLNGNNGTLVEGNTIHRPTRTPISEYRGVYMTSNSQRCSISKNRFHTPFGGNLAQNSACFAINLNLVNASAGNENVISNNAVYNLISNQTTTNMNALLINNSTYAKVYFNTFNLDHAAAVVTTGGTRGIYVQAPVANNGLDIRNNIITISRGGAGPKQCIYFEGTGINLSSDYNDLLMTSATGTVQLAYGNGAGYTSLLAWQQGTGQDLNSVSADPLYNSAATGDLTPTSSVIDNLGIPIPGIATDIMGFTRSAVTPDLGAFEFPIGPLSPVVLSFSATTKGEDVAIEWAIGSEANVADYSVERSSDGTSFRAIDQRAAALKEVPASYHTTDFAPFAQTHSNILFYRLRAGMQDGKSAYSKVVRVTSVGNQGFLVTAYPNPVGNSLNISINGTAGANARITIKDLNGRTIKAIVPTGTQTELDMSGIPQGTYFVTYEDDLHTQTMKVIKQ